MHDDLPASGWNEPSGQTTALVAPVDATKRPAGAGVHEGEPALALNVPAAHSVPDAAPAAENDPAGTGVHAVEAVAPVAALNVPAAQSDASVAPSTATNAPAGASVHEEEPALALNVPAAQSDASVAPSTATNAPAGASVQGAFPVALKVPGTQATSSARTGAGRRTRRTSPTATAESPRTMS
jgi:hypothetical protein